MKQKKPLPTRTGVAWRLGLLAALGVFLLAEGATAGAKVTSIDGEASQGEKRLSMHDEVAQGELVETTADTSCSLLLAEGAVLQACSGASLRLRPGREENESQIVELQAGELKASVGHRPADDPLEIHTPAAIATILGTTLHVLVDPETGDTTITSLQNRIRIESSDPNVKGSVTIEAGEQVVIKNGSPPSPKQAVEIAAIGGMSDCIDDARFHRAAVGADRESREAEVLDLVTAFDVPSVLPPVSSPSDPDVLGPVANDPTPTIQTGGAITTSGGVCQTTGCFLDEMPVRVPSPPPPCNGPVMEGCTF